MTQRLPSRTTIPGTTPQQDHFQRVKLHTLGFRTNTCVRLGNVLVGSCPDTSQIYYSTPFKEELHNRFNLISEERVNISKHNSENLMKIGWKIRKLWHFEVSQIFTKHFLTSRYEYANEWVDDVITSLLAIYFVHKILKILIFCPNLW